MMARAAARYNEAVRAQWRRGAVATLFACLSYLVLAAPARADEQFDVGPTPIVNVHITRGDVTIQTWDRPQVLISADNPPDVRQVAASEVDPRIPKQVQFASDTVMTDHGPVTLPAESFVLPTLPGTAHDAIVVPQGSGNMTITVPRSTAMVVAQVRAGHLTLDNYQGVFVAHARGAGVSLNHVSGTGFVESLKGRVMATNSSFDRLRVRTATGNMLFQGCTSHQIQATSTYGSIVYDNGSFEPGLARFESEHGNVALGVRGNAQIGAHSESGHVVSSFHDDDAQIQGGSTTQQATVHGGGPIVTATSKNGSVYLYSGSINDHPHVREELSGSARLPIRSAPPPPPPPAPRARPPR